MLMGNGIVADAIVATSGYEVWIGLELMLMLLVLDRVGYYGPEVTCTVFVDCIHILVPTVDNIARANFSQASIQLALQVSIKPESS